MKPYKWLPTVFLHWLQMQPMNRKKAHNKIKKKYCKDAYCIQTAVDAANFDRISHAETAKEAWDILVKYYEGGEKVKVVKLQTLHRQYELLSMGEDESVA